MIPIYYIVNGKLNKGTIMPDRITEIENAGIAEAELHRKRYPDATEDYLVGRRDGYIAALTDLDERETKWRYLVDMVPKADIQKTLNDWGNLGWEVCSVLKDG